MFGIGGWELLVIAVVALLVLGPKGLPGAARAIGRAVAQLRKATQELRDTIELDPDLNELPKTLDELNRPLLAPTPRRYQRPAVPLDVPPELEEQPPPMSAPAAAFSSEHETDPTGEPDEGHSREADAPVGEAEQPLEVESTKTRSPTVRETTETGGEQ